MCKHILIRDFTSDDINLVYQFIERTHENDGYGAIIRLNNGQLLTYKTLDIAAFYLTIGRWIGSNGVAELVVHHRTSTNHNGLEYAHPFEHQGHAMTHNGVVSMPGNYPTLTQNDSEMLLHHLLATNYRTSDVSGYFSCFVLNESETIVLVDSIAPIYTNGRVYCSHKLNDDMIKIELTRITYDVRSGTMSQAAIETTKSDYGNAWRGASLGDAWKERTMSTAESFLDLLSGDDIEYLSTIVSERELYREIEYYADSLGVELNDHDFNKIAGFLYWDEIKSTAM